VETPGAPGLYGVKGNTVKDDLEAIAFLFSAIALIAINTVLFSVASQWLTNVAYRAGLVSASAQWTIYIVGFCTCLGFVLTVASRLANGHWWFR